MRALVLTNVPGGPGVTQVILLAGEGSRGWPAIPATAAAIVVEGVDLTQSRGRPRTALPTCRVEAPSDETVAGTTGGECALAAGSNFGLCVVPPNSHWLALPFCWSPPLHICRFGNVNPLRQYAE